MSSSSSCLVWVWVSLLLACGSAPGEGDASSGDGSSGPGGSSGGSSSGGSSSSSSSGELPTTGDGSESGEVALDPRLAACLRVNACEAEGGTPIGLQVCLGHALDLPWLWASVGVQRLGVEAIACKLAADDCAAVRACTPTLAGFVADCEDAAGMGVCAGDTWVYCDDLGAPLAALDCAAAGLSCNVDIWAGCGSEPCEFAATEASCDGDTLVECNAAGFLDRIDCKTAYNLVRVHGMDGDEVFSIAGETCGYDEMRGANGCVGTGEVCDFFSQGCDGDALETCAGGKLGRRDCAAQEPAGQGCGYMQAGPFAGAASCGLVAPACDLGADESCEAGVIDFCDWDSPGSVDCLAVGYGGCAEAMLGSRRVAYCTP